jgi:hypothetical protein
MDLKSPREFWIFKGTSCHGDHFEYCLEDDQQIKTKPCGFYDLVSANDSIEGGIHVIEKSAYDALLKVTQEQEAEIEELKIRLEDREQEYDKKFKELEALRLALRSGAIGNLGEK